MTDEKPVLADDWTPKEIGGESLAPTEFMTEGWRFSRTLNDADRAKMVVYLERTPGMTFFEAPPTPTPVSNASSEEGYATERPTRFTRAVQSRFPDAE